MSELLVSPDVVDLVCALLRTQLPTIPDQSPVPVSRAVPSPRPSTFVRVRLLGGAGRDAALPRTDRVAIAVEAFALNVVAAHDLAQNARAVVHSSQGSVLGETQIYRVADAGAPVELPDPVSAQPRVTFSAELLVRTRRP